MPKRIDPKTKILTDDEVKKLCKSMKQVFGSEMWKTVKGYGGNIETTFRFSSVANYCIKAREDIGLSIKDVAAELKIPQYSIKDIENGNFRNLKPDILERYIDFPGESRWFSKWEKANPELTKQLFSKSDNKKSKPKRNGSLMGRNRTQKETP